MGNFSSVKFCNIDKGHAKIVVFLNIICCYYYYILYKIIKNIYLLF